MNQFALDAMTPVTVANVNIRSELHGDEHVPAVDIAIKLVASNTILSELDGALRGMLYKPAEDPQADAQPELDGVPPVSDLPLLRCAKLEPIRLKHEFAGYALTVDRGLGGSSNIIIGGCKVDKFRADCKEGGTVELSFRVAASGLDEATLGKLAMLIGAEVSIMLEAPEEAQAPIDGSKDGDAPRTGGWPFPGGPDGAGAPAIGPENRKSGEVLPMGAPRTKRGRDATRAFIDAHAPQGGGSVS